MYGIYLADGESSETCAGEPHLSRTYRTVEPSTYRDRSSGCIRFRQEADENSWLS
jgi:hypothetical protein